MKYRKKPLVVEAWHFTEENKDIVLNDLKKVPMDIRLSFDSMDRLCIIISTLEGEMIASLGDYIIKGIHGELYPCKAIIFEKTYEEINENENN